MKRSLYLVMILSVLGVFAFVTLAPAQDETTPVVVSIQDGYFDPADITVAPGTTVWWVNEGVYPHTVTADNGLFDSGTLYPGDWYGLTFYGQGTVIYHCSPEMPGSVTVA